MPAVETNSNTNIASNDVEFDPTELACAQSIVAAFDTTGTGRLSRPELIRLIKMTTEVHEDLEAISDDMANAAVSDTLADDDMFSELSAFVNTDGIAAEGLTIVFRQCDMNIVEVHFYLECYGKLGVGYTPAVGTPEATAVTASA